TTISKIWSSLRPDLRAAAKSSSVTLYACSATFSTSVLTGSASPALSNAARRRAWDASPSPSRTRATSALRACLISDICASRRCSVPWWRTHWQHDVREREQHEDDRDRNRPDERTSLGGQLGGLQPSIGRTQRPGRNGERQEDQRWCPPVRRVA